MHQAIFTRPVHERGPGPTLANCRARAVAFVRRTGESVTIFAHPAGPGEGYGWLVSSLYAYQAARPGCPREKLAEVALTPDGVRLTWAPGGSARAASALLALVAEA